MNKFVSVGLGAAAVVVALVIGTQVPGPSAPGDVGSAASASPSITPAPTATTEPSPSPISAPPLTQSFTSTLHGFSVSYPEGWTAEEATEPWTGGGAPYAFIDPQLDRLYDMTLTDHMFLTIASQPIGDSTPEDWIAEQVAGYDEGCTPAEPITVGEASGLIGSEGCDFAAVTTDGRGYAISTHRSNDDPSAVAAYDRAWFEEVLATVELHPKDAVD